MRFSEARTARETEAAPTMAEGRSEPAEATATAGTRAAESGVTHPTRRDRGGRAPRRETMPPSVVLDRYVLRKRLGSGAFGTVWMASDERLERDVAVKMLPRERIVGGRFEREARVAARLSHPGIVTLYEASMDDQGAYLVSELVRGSTLDQLLAAGRLSDQDIIDIGVGLCDALDHAHGQGIVHRDVKPSNILVPERPSSSAQVAKLTDFGVARVVGGDSLTRTGDIIGTVAYMAPEQAEGLEAGPSADLYSLALVLYEALTGINPVQTAGGMVRNRRLGAYLPPLRRQRRDLPRALGSGIDMALRPRARERGRILDLRRALVASYDLVGDEPGVVGDAWTTVRDRDRDRGRDRDRDRDGDRDREHDHEARKGWARTRRRTAAERDEARDEERPVPARADNRWVNRGLGALASAATAVWLARHALAPAPLPAALLALICAGVTLLVPRIGWLTLTAVVAVTAVAQGHSGLVLLLVPGALTAVMLVPWRPTAWPLPAGAVALGVIGLAGAWPAMAGWASSAWRRAALAGAGWIWLLLAAPITGHALYLNWLPASSAAVWSGSIRGTVDMVIMPLLSAGVLAPAAVWALAACVLPWMVRGRSLILDAVLVVIWSATVVGACTAVIEAIHPAPEASTAPPAVLGAIVGALLALGRAWQPRPGGLLRRVAEPFRAADLASASDSGVGPQFP